MLSLLSRSIAKRGASTRALSAFAGAPFKLPDLTYDYGELEPFVRAVLIRPVATWCAFVVAVTLRDSIARRSLVKS